MSPVVRCMRIEGGHEKDVVDMKQIASERVAAGAEAVCQSYPSGLAKGVKTGREAHKTILL